MVKWVIERCVMNMRIKKTPKDMKKHLKRSAAAFAAAGSLAIVNSAVADAYITTFDDFNSDAMYASWSGATVESTATNYIITATGYGSNYKWIGWPLIDGTGCTKVELDVTLSGPAAADGQLGPIVDLIDGDGTRYSYRWYGRPLGHQILTMPVESPTAVVGAGSKPGLNLADLQHMHMQLDPGGLGTSGAYTIAWNSLRLTGRPVPPIIITSQSYDPATRQFTLTWTSADLKSYSIGHSSNASSGYAPLLVNVPTGGTTTTVTVVLPEAPAGFVRVQQE